MASPALRSLRIDPDSAVAPFEQLRAQLADAVIAGDLVAGERLPPVRTLAEQLGIAPGTAARAFRELEASGFIETRGRHGSFVAPQGDPVMEQAQRAAAAFAAQMHSLRIDADRAVALVAAALAADGPSRD